MKTGRNVFLKVLSVIVILATVLPEWQAPYWWVRSLDFPRLQLAILGLIVLSLSLLKIKQQKRSGFLLLGLLTASIGYQIYRILPYMPWMPEQTFKAVDQTRENSLSLLIANVQMSNRRTDDFISLAREIDADLILVTEPDQEWEEALRPLESSYHYTVKHPLQNTYGILLYSKLPLEESQVLFLIEPDIPSVQTTLRLRSGESVEAYFVHPKPPWPTQNPTSLPRDAELLRVADKIKNARNPIIVAGDLNDVAWSHTTRLFQRVSRLLDPRRGRGLYNTFHAKTPFLRFPLDHVFHSEHFRLVHLEKLRGFGSDHFPIFVNLSLEPLTGKAQDEPTPKPGDTQEAHEKIEEASQPDKP